MGDVLSIISKVFEKKSIKMHKEYYNYEFYKDDALYK